MRNLSFALTTAQVRARTKTVTRRRGTWWATVLKPGDLLCAVEKSQGIKKGGLVRLGTIRVTAVRVERLNEMLNGAPTLAEIAAGRSLTIGAKDVVAEGFPGMSPVDFVHMFMRHMGRDGDQLVTRIEFEYVDGAPDRARAEGGTR